ncbi:MAG: PEP-CTERM sorting domain-containing protein [Terriglobales bacterium]
MLRIQRALMLGVFAAVCLGMGAGSAKADPVVVNWQLINVSFADGAVANGFLQVTYDISGKVLTAWDVDISGGTDLQAQTIGFDPTSSSGALSGDPLFDLLQNDPFQLQLITGPIPPTAGTTNILSGSFSDTGFTSPVNPGQELVATPEPGTWALFGGGFLLMGWAWRRRLKAADNL